MSSTTKRPERLFLIFSTFFGLLFVFLVPPLQAPDENSHFLRAYQVSDFNFTSDPIRVNGVERYGGYVPKSINEAAPALLGDVAGKPQNKFQPGLIKKYIAQPLNQADKEPTIVEAGGMYSPIVYIPQSIGINIGKVFNASPLLLIWLGRLANLLFWILLVYFAVKLIPVGKWALAILALNPVSTFLSASLSPDVTNVGLAFLFIAIVFSAVTSSATLSHKKIALILFVLAALSLGKPVNLIFALLLFVIPVRQFGGWKRYATFVGSGVVLAVGLFVLWNLQAKPVVDAAILSQSGGLNVSSSGQISYIFSQPVSYIWDIIRNYVLVSPRTYGDAVLTTLFGVVGWLDTNIPFWTITTYTLGLFLALLYGFGRGAVLTIRQKAWLAVIFMLGFVGNITAMYLNATTVGSGVIAGVQGRYFMAILPLLFGIIIFPKKILNITNKSMALVAATTILIVLSMTTIKIFLRYYQH